MLWTNWLLGQGLRNVHILVIYDPVTCERPLWKTRLLFSKAIRTGGPGPAP